MLPAFRFRKPSTLDEALEMLAAEPETQPIAGGTNLIVDARAGTRKPEIVLDLGHLSELRGIEASNDGIRIGATTTITDLLESEAIATHAGALHAACRSFANPLIRNRATIGGNLCYASPATDTAPPLLVLEAEVELASRDGVRRVPMQDYIAGVRRTVRRPEELLTAVHLPAPVPGGSSVFRKVALRKADAITVVSAAVFLERAEDGRCARLRIALGAVAPTPIRATAAEDALLDSPPTPEAIDEAARRAADATSCIDDARATAAYRSHVSETLVRRLLTDLVSNEESGERP